MVRFTEVVSIVRGNDLHIMIVLLMSFNIESSVQLFLQICRPGSDGCRCDSVTKQVGLYIFRFGTRKQLDLYAN